MTKQCLLSSLIIVGVLNRFFERQRSLQAKHERGLPAHWVGVVPVIVYGDGTWSTRQRVLRLLVRGWGEAELLFLLLLQVSEDGLGQEVRVVLLLIFEQDECVAVATLQRVIQYVLQGPVEEQNLLSALRLPETSAALLGHAVKR